MPCLAYLSPNVRNRRLHNVIAPATRFESQQLFRPPRPLRPSRSSSRHLIHDDMATAPMTWPSVGFLVGRVVVSRIAPGNVRLDLGHSTTMAPSEAPRPKDVRSTEPRVAWRRETQLDNRCRCAVLRKYYARYETAAEFGNGVGSRRSRAALSRNYSVRA